MLVSVTQNAHVGCDATNQEGGQVKFYPTKKGREARKCISHADGGHNMIWGNFDAYTSFGPMIFPFCSPY